jgi:integrase
LVELRKGTAPDFEEAAKACYEARRGSWRNGKHQDQWISSLKTYAFPILGRIRVDLIETSHVIDVLQPIWIAKPETARRVRQRVGLVLDWAKAKGFRTTSSPTREIGRALPEHKSRQKHHTALHYNDVPGFIRELRASGASNATKGALEYLILTASRTTETLRLKWSEVDLENALWSVPAERMKSGRAHTVPLPDRALEILRSAKPLRSCEGSFVFESRPGKPLSNMSLLMVMRRMNVAGVPHGFRSSFRTWAAETTNHPREVAEACLAHVTPDKVERAYQRSDFLQRRRAMMEAWARWCCNEFAEVVELRSRKSNA